MKPIAPTLLTLALSGLLLPAQAQLVRPPKVITQQDLDKANQGWQQEKDLRQALEKQRQTLESQYKQAQIDLAQEKQKRQALENRPTPKPEVQIREVAVPDKQIQAELAKETQRRKTLENKVLELETQIQSLSQRLARATPAPAPAPAPQANLPAPGTRFKACQVCPELVWLPQGQYRRGSPTNERERDSDEGPVRVVSIKYTLAAGRYPVTFAEWDACADAGVCSRPQDRGWGRGRRPVINVSHDEITGKYLPWLNAQAEKAGLLPAGYRFRLPTESEREFYARGITDANAAHPPFPSLPNTPWAAGTCPDTRAFNYDGNSDYAGCGAKTGVYRAQTLPVDDLPYPNAFGLHGVAGQLWEWSQDCYYDSYAQTPDDGRPAAEKTACSRVLRGGSWDDDSTNLRAAVRNNNTPDNRGSLIGFRVVLSSRI